METANDATSADAVKLSRSWIDVFASCGTVMGRILSFLDEIEVLQLERTNEKVTPEVTDFQWAYLDALDQMKTTNQRWRQKQADGHEDDLLSRPRGIDFANHSLYAKKRTAEAFLHFEFDRDNASPEDIPVRHHIRLEVTKGGTVQHQQQSTPACWQKWADLGGLDATGNNAVIIDVFLDLSVHRDNPSDILSWRGFRKARYQRYQGISLKLDLDPLATEMGWNELLSFRDNSKDYAFTHFEVEESQKQMKSLMQKIQVTLHIANNLQVPSDHDPLMIISTGGYASPAWAQRGNHMVLARNCNICRFHCRNGKQPLAETFEDASRSAFLRIPTSNSADQSLGIMLKMYD